MRTHTATTLRIQRRLERLELQHLRDVVAEQGSRLELLERELADADRAADMWRDHFFNLQQRLADGTSDARCIGLTRGGALLVIGLEEGQSQ